jgi:phenylpropionate dioxygenase-like ring-hydroxylating dioxygenase large terminal subunit
MNYLRNTWYVAAWDNEVQPGKLDGDAIQCGYHGLKFNGQGVCVHNPHGAIPKAATVRSYPAVERYSFVWVWMGEQLAREQIAYLRAPFEQEDLPMLEAQQGSLAGADLFELKPVLLAGDAGGVRARRALAKLLAAEQAGTKTTAST